MDKKLNSLLEHDEKLLWSGRPERFETLDKTNKKSIVIGLIIKVVVTLGLTLGYIHAARSAAGIKPGVLVVLLAIFAWAVANPFLIARRLREKTIYGLTDRRVLRAGANDESVPYDRMKSVVLRTDADGHTTLLCGPRTKDLKPHQWRGEADAAFINGPDDPECVRLILYALPMSVKLKMILEDHLSISQ